jgi:hypothetical protein
MEKISKRRKIEALVNMEKSIEDYINENKMRVITKGEGIKPLSIMLHSLRGSESMLDFLDKETVDRYSQPVYDRVDLSRVRTEINVLLNKITRYDTQEALRKNLANHVYGDALSTRRCREKMWEGLIEEHIKNYPGISRYHSVKALLDSGDKSDEMGEYLQWQLEDEKKK